jgi:hypothetical protein
MEATLHINVSGQITAFEWSAHSMKLQISSFPSSGSLFTVARILSFLSTGT